MNVFIYLYCYCCCSSRYRQLKQLQIGFSSKFPYTGCEQIKRQRCTSKGNIKGHFTKLLK